MQTSRGYEFMGVNPPSFPSIPPHSNAPLVPISVTVTIFSPLCASVLNESGQRSGYQATPGSQVSMGRHTYYRDNGAFGTHWATRIFVPPSRQNRSIRHPTGKYQWASGRIFCTLSSAVHMTFTFMAKKNMPEQICLI